jgi:hypothetical protein
MDDFNGKERYALIGGAGKERCLGSINMPLLRSCPCLFIFKERCRLREAPFSTIPIAIGIGATRLYKTVNGKL